MTLIPVGELANTLTCSHLTKYCCSMCMHSLVPDADPTLEERGLGAGNETIAKIRGSLKLAKSRQLLIHNTYKHCMLIQEVHPGPYSDACFFLSFFFFFEEATH